MSYRRVKFLQMAGIGNVLTHLGLNIGAGSFGRGRRESHMDGFDRFDLVFGEFSECGQAF